jgi:hypothetical protein
MSALTRVMATAVVRYAYISRLTTTRYAQKRKKPRIMTEAEENADTEKRKWLLVHNWCSFGWESLGAHYLETEDWMESGPVTPVSEIRWCKTEEEGQD